MKISYSAFDLSIVSEKPLIFDTMPEFLFRSIIGNELRMLTCLFKKRKCDSCDLRHQCAYSVIFETPVSREWSRFEGRNYASHPFILSSENEPGNPHNLRLNITMLGRYIDYFPYIFYAVIRGGENGIGRERIRYKIESVTNKGKEIFHDGMLKTDGKKESWELACTKGGASKNYLIEIKSPLRIQKEGKLISQIDYDEFMTAIRRRMEILCELYGDKGSEIPEIRYEPKTVTPTLKWSDNTRWSSRQKRTMTLGGIIGTIELKGRFTPLERSLIQAGEIFHIGKNTAFGLGKIKVREFK